METENLGMRMFGIDHAIQAFDGPDTEYDGTDSDDPDFDGPDSDMEPFRSYLFWSNDDVV